MKRTVDDYERLIEVILDGAEMLADAENWDGRTWLATVHAQTLGQFIVDVINPPKQPSRADVGGTMTIDDIQYTIDDRLRAWTTFLYDENATPLLIVASKHPENRLVIATTKGMSNTDLRALLVGAVALLDAAAQSTPS